MFLVVNSTTRPLDLVSPRNVCSCRLSRATPGLCDAFAVTVCFSNTIFKYTLVPFTIFGNMLYLLRNWQDIIKDSMTSDVSFF